MITIQLEYISCFEARSETVKHTFLNSSFKLSSSLISLSKVVECPIDYEKIYSYVMMLFTKHYTHEPLRLIGVTLNNVKRKDSIIQQMNIFDTKNNKTDPIDSLIENINK